MTKYIGRRVNIGIAKESSRGTAVSATFWLPKTGVAFFDRALKQKSNINYGTIGAGAYAPKIREWAEGTFDSDMFDKSFGLILLAAFGTVSTSGPSDSAYTHTYSLADSNQHQSLTLTIADPDRTDQFTLAVLDSLQIRLNPEDVVTFTAKFFSRTGRAVAAASASYAAENKFLSRHAIIKVASTAAGLSAASALSLKMMTLNINKNVKLNNILGTVWPDDILNTVFEINGEIELDLDDQTYRTYMLDGSYKAMRIQLVNSDVLIGTSSQPTFTLDLSRVHFEAWEAARNNDEIVTQKITFQALYDITNGNIINSCTLVNAQSSY